jgi:hypothetical protein
VWGLGASQQKKLDLSEFLETIPLGAVVLGIPCIILSLSLRCVKDELCHPIYGVRRFVVLIPNLMQRLADINLQCDVPGKELMSLFENTTAGVCCRCRKP